MPASRSTSRTASSRVTLSVAAIALFTLAAPALAQFAPGFQTFQAPEGLAWAPAMLSDDGAVVSGNVGAPGSNVLFGFTLTPLTYTQFSESGTVFDISNAGAYTSLYNGRRAADGTIEVLDPSITTPTTGRLGSSISRDGRAIAASNQIQPSSGGSPVSNRAYRWTEGFGVTILPQYRPGAAFTEALDISGNGQVIVGSGRMSTFADKEAWVWTESNGLTILQDAPGSTFVSYQANAINNDGSIVAGFGVDTGVGLRGLIWRDGGVTPLPAPSGYRTATVHDLSDDGQVIVGQLGNSNSGLPTTDAVWTDATGWVPIFDYLRSRGVDVPLSYSSQNVDVSADGLTFAGTATDSITGERVVFVAVVPAPSAAAMLAVGGLMLHRRRRKRAAVARCGRTAAAITATVVAAPALAQFAPGFQTFQAPEGLAWAPAMLSDDGTTVSGNVFIPRTNIINGFTLTPTTYTQFAESGTVFDISNAGAYTSLYNGRRAADGTIEVLDPSVTQPTGEGVGSSISRDGRTIAASNQIQPPGSSPTSNRAYRWTEGFGVTILPQYRPGAAFTEALDISGNGQVIVGSGRMSTFADKEAWVWTEAGGLTILPDVPGGRFVYYEALATNNDGSIIVGQGSAPEPFDRGIKWVNGVATPLPAPAGYRDASAFDLSDDGSIIVGQIGGSLTGLPRTDAVWTDATGWVPIFDYLRSRGVDVPLSYSSQNVDVSADGLTFAGTATDSVTGERVVFVAVVPSPSSLAALALLFGLRRRTRNAIPAAH